MVRGSEREMGGWKDSKRAASVVLEGEQRRGFGDEGRGLALGKVAQNVSFHFLEYKQLYIKNSLQEQE